MNTRIIRSLITLPFLLAMGTAGPVWAQTQSEIQKLTASDGDIVDEFGDVVAVDGNTAVVGARLDDDGGFDSGSAYVFTRNSGVWTEQQKLTASDAAANNFFGKRVAVDGDTIVIGAEDGSFSDSVGSAYVFVRNAGVWTEQQKLTASDAAQGDLFGSSVAVDGDTAIIGAAQDDDKGRNSGSAYVFTRNAGVWTEQQKLIASNGFDFDDFGNAVAMDGDTAVIGARWGDNGGEWSDVGAAYVFTRESGVWTEQQKLLASDGAFEDQFGVWVTLDGDTAIIGAKWDDDSGSKSGSAYVFIRNAGVWTEQQKLTASDGAAGHEFGAAVAVSGNSAVIGARFDDDNGSESGSAYLFTRSAEVWTEQPKLIPSDAAAFDEFGQGIAMDEETVLVGADRDDDNGPASGSVYVFEVRGTDTLAAVGDVNGNSSPDFVVLKLDEVDSVYSAYVMDGSTGNKIRRIGFGPEVPIAMEIVTQADLSPAVAVLRKLENGQNNVLVKDLASGAKVGNLFYGSVYDSIDLADAGDTDNSGSPDIAVLGVNDAQKVRIQLRDLATGGLIDNIFQGNDAEPVQLEVLPDANGGNGPEIAVLGVRYSDSRARVWIQEISTKTTVRRITYGSVYAPGFMAFAPDAEASGQHGVALVGTRSDTGRNRIQVRAISDGSLISNAFYNNANQPVDIGTTADTGVDGAADIAVLFEIPDGTGRVSLSESRTGVFLRNVPLPAIQSPSALAVSADINGNGKEEVAGLGDADDGTTKRIDVRDANSKASVNQIEVP